MIYEPREDSYLLEKAVKKLAFGSVLDIGTGSGIQAKAAAKKKNVKSVLAVDVQKKVVDHCKKIKNKKISCKQSDLFSKVSGQFDTIIFNAPYLPEKVGDLTLEGGKKGYEIVVRFLADVNSYLKTNGIALLVISSLTKPEKVEESLKGLLMDYEIVAEQHIFFEDLLVYKIWKNDLRKTLEGKKISDIHYFARGKRGIVYTGKMGKKKIAIKTKRPESEAVGRIQNEKDMIQRVNKKGIGPKFRLFIAPNILVYEFVEGEFLKDFTGRAKKQEIKKVLKKVLDQCYTLDKMGINKEEMHRPLKHVIVGKQIVMIDFERARRVERLQNVTQFCQYIGNIFPQKRNKLTTLARNYKKNPTKANYTKIVKVI